ncbi:MAG: 3'(2'),5'-bisphosphate nucleotidase CysQ [Bacteriovoracaceae bacterium]
MIEIMTQITKEAGKIIMEIYNSDSSFGIQEKGDGSPVTKADLAANKYIVESLEKEFPDIPIISEEIKAKDYETRKSWDKFFLVDPIDGTKEFIKRNGEFTVNIAYCESDGPKIGVIDVPAFKETYWGSLDGAFVERGKKIYSLPQRTMSKHKFRVAASRSHMTDKTKAVIKVLEEKFGKIEILQYGSSLKMCKVAEGEVDYYPRLGPTYEWDTAAAHAILRAAGGEITIAGTDDPLKYNKEDLLNPHFEAKRKDIL